MRFEWYTLLYKSTSTRKFLKLPFFGQVKFILPGVDIIGWLALAVGLPLASLPPPGHQAPGHQAKDGKQTTRETAWYRIDTHTHAFAGRTPVSTTTARARCRAPRLRVGLDAVRRTCQWVVQVQGAEDSGDRCPGKGCCCARGAGCVRVRSRSPQEAGRRSPQAPWPSTRPVPTTRTIASWCRSRSFPASLPASWSRRGAAARSRSRWSQPRRTRVGG